MASNQKFQRDCTKKEIEIPINLLLFQFVYLAKPFHSPILKIPSIEIDC